jgi:hypothetical protein
MIADWKKWSTVYPCLQAKKAAGFTGTPDQHETRLISL